MRTMHRLAIATLLLLLAAAPARADIYGDLVLHVAGDSSLADSGSGSHTVAISSGTADYDTSGNPVGSAALDVGANSRYPIVTDDPDLSFGASNADGSITLWEKTSVTATIQALLSQYDADNNDVDIIINASNGVQAVFRGASAANLNTSSPNVCDGAWHHIAITWTYDTGTTFDFVIYVDGVVIYTNSLAWTPTADTADLCIGARPGGANIHGGQIDDVRVYNGRALTASEVVDLVALGPLTRLEVGQKGHWALNETSGNFVDLSGNGYTLTIAGSPTYLQPSAGGSLGTAIGFGGSAAGYVNNVPVCRNAAEATLSVWLQPTNLTTSRWAIFVSNGTGTSNSRLAIQVLATTGAIRVYARAGDAEGPQNTTSGTGIIAGEWSHIAAVVDFANDTIAIYINGVLAADTAVSFAATATSDTNAQRVTVGGIGGSGDFVGDIDDARVYARVLSADDVAALYALGTDSTSPAIYSFPTTRVLSSLRLRRFDVLTQQFKDCQPCYALAP